MKILLVLNHFMPQQTAGTEVYTWSLANELLKKGAEITVVIPNYGNQESIEYTFNGIRVIKFAESSLVDRSLILGFRMPEGVAIFKKLLENQKPDIVHFQEIAGSNGITLHHIKTAKSFGAKVIMTFHLSINTCITGTLSFQNKLPCNGIIDLKKCTECYLHTKSPSRFINILTVLNLLLLKIGWDTRKWNHPVGTALGTGFILNDLGKKLKVLAASCNQMVVLTKWYKEVLLANGISEKKITHISQGLPYPVLGNQNHPKIASSSLHLIFVGRLSPFKGVHLLISAMNELTEYSIQLDIYGQSTDADYESELRASSAHLKNIQWKGLLKQEEVVLTMQSYDALCLCSTFSEMSPLVIQEAFAAGIPVIASNVYGNAEQLTDGVNGLLFELNSVSSLSNILKRCASNKELLHELKLNIKSPKLFSEVADEYFNLYNSLF